MHWKKQIDLAATLLAVLISLFAISRAFAGRLTGTNCTRPLEMSTPQDCCRWSGSGSESGSLLFASLRSGLSAQDWNPAQRPFAQITRRSGARSRDVLNSRSLSHRDCSRHKEGR